MKRATPPDSLALAVQETSGAALVLDSALRVLLATPAAESLLGFDVPVGSSAPKLLCGEATRRPVAEALAAGRPTQALLPRPTLADPERVIRIRTAPLGKGKEGWLLFLEEAKGAAAEGEVLFHGMWTQHDSMKQMFRVVERVARVDAPVLVRGETGAGKELVATALHALSARRNGPLRALNCAALPPHLLESELFGHVRGAFTGAVRDTPGHVVSANGGTLFLDEVAELPLELQAKLLRVLETRTVLPVGARTPVPIDVRFVSATHRSLREEVALGKFRADLMYRLRVIPVFLSPLRARTGDVMLLVEKLLTEHNARNGRRIEKVAPATARVLSAYGWPGNVRELRNVLEYAYAIGDGAVLTPSDLPMELSLDAAEPGDLGRETAAEALPEAERATPEARRIIVALERNAGSRGRAARVLGMSRVTLWRRMKSLGLS
jgi:transcriptional regulator with PAS, ATPase and Fis domain